ncbi:hypothetical protein GCM10009863_29500 [Streptomyces axinellae]|uniref:Uncharacterized protein n=1 Tax=Streptomyces axinellae TaxID=552788 RepID=A0ABP6CFU6_9ACTN
MLTSCRSTLRQNAVPASMAGTAGVAVSMPICASRECRSSNLVRGQDGRDVTAGVVGVRHDPERGCLPDMLVIPGSAACLARSRQEYLPPQQRRLTGQRGAAPFSLRPAVAARGADGL